MKRLDDYGSELRRMMSDSATGPLKAAVIVCEQLAPHWDERYKAAADGMALTSWLTQTCGSTGQGLRFFRERYEALEHFERSAKNWVHHELAVWIVGKTKDKATLRKVHEAWREMYRQNNRQPLTPSQGRRIAWPIIGKPENKRLQREKRAYQRIEQLEAYIRSKGLHVPPWLSAVA